MCGLTGFIAQSNSKQINKTIFTLLMASNDSRGGDSTGYYDGDKTYKCIGKSNGLFDKFMGLETNFVIGHTRKSTHGITNIPNQHPFKYGTVLGAHNGQLRNYKEVGEKHNLKETDVDSQMIFKILNKTQDVQSLGLFEGTLATLFKMKDDNRLYTYRHNNPMWVGKDGEGNAYFSSLKEPLLYAGLNDIFQLKEDRVYIWENGEVVQRIDIIQKPVPKKQKAISYSNYGDYEWYQDYKPKKQKYKRKYGVYTKSNEKPPSQTPQLSMNLNKATTMKEISEYNASFKETEPLDDFQSRLTEGIETVEDINSEFHYLFDFTSKQKMQDLEIYLKSMRDEFYY